MKSNHQTGKLAGQTVLVPRPAPLPGRTDKLADLLESAGANVISHPVIELIPAALQSASPILGRLGHYRTIVFVSAPGVFFFCRLLAKLQRDPAQQLTNQYVVAIGSGTASELEQQGVRIDFVPNRADSRSLAEGLVAGNADEPVLLIRADRGSQELSDSLSRAGKSHEQLVVYNNRDILDVSQTVQEKLDSGEIDWIPLTSPSIARSCLKLFQNAVSKTKLSSISSSVTSVVEPTGIRVTAEASSPGFEELVESMARTC